MIRHKIPAGQASSAHEKAENLHHCLPLGGLERKGSSQLFLMQEYNAGTPELLPPLTTRQPTNLLSESISIKSKILQNHPLGLRIMLSNL